MGDHTEADILEEKITFTVCTLVYNGARTIDRVFQSLKSQSFTDFEWIVIDDGSVDDTAAVVEKMKAQTDMRIQLYRQANMHKFYSLLRGITLAKGTFFLVADADDAFRGDTLETFYTAFHTIPRDQQARFVGVNCLCKDAEGQIVGDPYPRHHIVSDHNELRFRYKVSGEKWGMQKTEILRQYTFPPEYFNNGYIPESLLWGRIADAGYKILCLNEPLRTYYNDTERISISTRSGANRKKNSFGSMQAMLLELNTQLKYFRYDPVYFIKSAIRYMEASAWQGIGTQEQIRRLNPKARWLYWMAYPAGILRTKLLMAKKASV